MLGARRPPSGIAGALQPYGAAPGPEFSLGHLPQHVDVEGLVSHDLLQALVLFLQLAELLGVVGLHAPVLVHPALPRGRGDL